LVLGCDGTDEMTIGGGTGGVRVGVPTGAFKGLGTLNATAVYDDNVLLTCMAMARKFVETGVFDDSDVAQWDARVPSWVEPKHTEKMPIMVDVEELVRVRQPNGTLRLERRTRKRPKTVLTPVYAEDGNDIIGTVEEPATELVTIPEKVIPRQHGPARLFKRMIDDGFDPRQPAQYIAKMKADGALPGMPNVATWRQNELSQGEMFCRLWLATEMLALAFASLTARVEALEAG
jgi:hypothetical protein